MKVTLVENGYPRLQRGMDQNYTKNSKGVEPLRVTFKPINHTWVDCEGNDCGDKKVEKGVPPTPRGFYCSHA